jgi:transcription elongation GreA/GreB family factor
VICCGEDRHSRFCPECGGPLAGNAVLIGLLKYCQARVRQFQELLERRQHVLERERDEGQGPGSTVDYHDRESRVRKTRKTLDEWKARVGALEQILGIEKPATPNDLTRGS